MNCAKCGGRLFEDEATNVPGIGLICEGCHDEWLGERGPDVDPRTLVKEPGRYRVRRLVNGSEWILHVRPDGGIYLASIDGRVPSGQAIGPDTAVREFGDPYNWRPYEPSPAGRRA